MDSFEKRQRERRKREKRTEKLARRRERSELAKKQRAEVGTTSISTTSVVPGGDQPRAVDDPATGIGSRDELV